MCGIVGFTHLDRSVDPARIRRATRSLIHRGPDQQGVFETATVSLGAVRLKIIDLEHGQQPMHAGPVTIVFNGEVYNHAEVRQELEALGHQFDSRCDTEVVLRAFVQWDVECFKRLRGMFGVALWNEATRRLVLARDRLGIKPLYIAFRNRDIYFASELKGILEHPEIDRHLSAQGLHHYLSLNYVPCPYTLIDGVEKLRPGYWLEWRDGEVRSEPYWRLNLQPDPKITLDAAKEELDSLLYDSVKEHLVSDVPLGVWASGGLDSSTIVHYARQTGATRLKTFSVSFKGRKFDESEYFREIAAAYDTDHHEFDLSPNETLPGVVEQLSYYSDEPSADAGAVPVWYLSEMTRRQVTVALSGEGADELFGGYVTYLADRYARSFRCVPRAARRLAGVLTRFLPVSDEKAGLEYKLRRFIQGSLLPELESHVFWNGTFSEMEKERLHLRNGHRPTSELLDSIFEGGAKPGYLNRYLWLDQSFYLPDDILYKCDRMSMAHSLEVRPPFLDHRIVEFAGRLPESLKVQGQKLKYVLRSLMNDKLPQSILTRRKEGFDIPAHQWLRTCLKPLLMDTINRRTVEDAGVFHWSEVESILRAHLDRRANFGYHLWGLLVLFLWMKRWNVIPSPSQGEPETILTTA